MAFMVPQYIEASERYPMFVYDGEAPSPERDDTNATECERVTAGVFFRLSAPGYMDCTDWSGPYDTLDEAKAECERMFDCDPETGDDLDES
jgi:hypothetical protein